MPNLIGLIHILAVPPVPTVQLKEFKWLCGTAALGAAVLPYRLMRLLQSRMMGFNLGLSVGSDSSWLLPEQA